MVFILAEGDRYDRCVFVDYASDFDYISRSLPLNNVLGDNIDGWINKCLCCYFPGKEQYTVLEEA